MIEKERMKGLEYSEDYVEDPNIERVLVTKYDPFNIIFGDNMTEDPVEGKDYKIDMYGNIIWTRQYLVDRGYCCGDGCLHCPYVPKHKEGNKTLADNGGDYYGGPA